MKKEMKEVKRIRESQGLNEWKEVTDLEKEIDCGMWVECVRESGERETRSAGIRKKEIQEVKRINHKEVSGRTEEEIKQDMKKIWQE